MEKLKPSASLGSSFFMALIISLFGQETVNNAARPLSKTAGRVVELEEILRIRETGDQFFFKFPYNIKILPTGEIYVQDQDQLLQFGADGGFLRNLYKKGQGPGEMGYVANYVLDQDKIIIHSVNPNKVLWLNSDGSLWREFTLPEDLAMAFLRHYAKETYYFQKSSWPEMKGNEEIREVPQDIICFSETSGRTKTVASFPTRYFLVQGGAGKGMLSIDKFLVTPWLGTALAISHTQEYLVKVFDPEIGRVVRAFRRDYRRVRDTEKVDQTKKPRVILNDKTFTAPPQKYQDDIKNLLAHEGQLWVMTSTVDERKGVLFDVFDKQGRYIDNFYIRFPHGLPDPSFGFFQMALSGDSLYLIEKDENDVSTLVKYRLR